MKSITSVLFLLAIFASSSVFAGEAHNNYFISVSTITGFAEIDGISSTGPVSRANQDSSLNDEVYGLRTAVGKRINNFRVGLEYSWRYRFDYDTRFGNAFDTVVSGFKSDIMTHSVMANLIWDFENSTRFTPFLLGSVGWLFHDIETTRTSFSAGPPVQQSNETETDDFGWALGAGVAYEISDHWRAEFTYRYSDFGDLDLDAFPDGGAMVADDYFSHDIGFGLTYHF